MLVRGMVSLLTWLWSFTIEASCYLYTRVIAALLVQSLCNPSVCAGLGTPRVISRSLSLTSRRILQLTKEIICVYIYVYVYMYLTLSPKTQIRVEGPESEILSGERSGWEVTFPRTSICSSQN